MKKVKAKTAAMVATAQPQQKSNPDRSVVRKPDEFRQIARLSLEPDPDQVRKTFDEAKLDELALSIMAEGIVQPLIVRLIPAKFKITEPDLTSKDFHVHELVDGVWLHAFQAKSRVQCEAFAGDLNLVDRIVIVAGERRWRASAPRDIKTDAGAVKWEGLDELPCLVRDMDAQRKYAQQVIENHQRENVTALEEAASFAKQIEERKKTDPTFSAEKLAVEVGVQRATMYERLKLTRLHPPVRQALLDGKINTSVASAIAVVPLPNQQEKLLAKVTNENDWHFPFSVREVQNIVDAEYCVQLKEAPFELSNVFAWDKKFPAEVRVESDARAGGLVMGCEACPFRSGNMLELFPELKSRPNACTRPDCFNLKCKTHWLAKAENAKEAGKVVMTPAEFNKVKGDYLAGDKEEWESGHGKYMSFEAMMGKHKPVPVLVASKEGLKKYFKREEAMPAMKKNGCKMSDHRQQQVETPDQKTAREAKEKADELAGERRQQLTVDHAPQVAAAMLKLKDADLLKLLAESFSKPTYFHNDLNKHLWKALEKTPRGQVIYHVMQLDAVDHNGAWEKKPLALFKELGIDLVAEEKKAEEAAQDTLLLTSSKKGGEKQLENAIAEVISGKRKSPNSKKKKGKK